MAYVHRAIWRFVVAFKKAVYFCLHLLLFLGVYLFINIGSLKSNAINVGIGDFLTFFGFLCCVAFLAACLQL